MNLKTESYERCRAVSDDEAGILLSSSEILLKRLINRGLLHETEKTGH